MNIFIAGHNGMVGSAITKELSRYDKNKIITANRSNLDLLDQRSVVSFFRENNIDQ